MPKCKAKIEYLGSAVVDDVVTAENSSGLLNFASLQVPRVRSKTIEIGNWDMTADFTHETDPHGLTFVKIRAVEGVLINNSQNLILPIPQLGVTYNNNAAPDVGFWKIDSTRVHLEHLGSTSIFYNDSEWDQVGGPYNRGWITIHYVD